MGRYWSLVHAKTSRETVAEEHLQRQGFRVFLPKKMRVIRHARRERQELRAFFPSYLFIEIDPNSTQWRPINSTVGVVRLVTVGAEPVRAPAGFVETMLEGSDADGLVKFTPSFAPGESVRVVRGPFAEQLGVIEALGDADRVRVLLDMMESRVAVDLRASHLSRA